MGDKQAPQHRDTQQSIEDLVAHVQYKLDCLPELAKQFNLGEEAVNGLRAHLQSEIDYLHNLPQETTLREVMENHFEKGAQFREGVTGNKESR